jgi:hypothetical protein
MDTTTPAEATPPGTTPADATPAATRPEGPISAAIIASGVGALALGLLTTLAEASTQIKDWLQWNTSVGPLSGKTSMAVIIWLAVWVVLHFALRHKPYETRGALLVAIILIGLGVLGTFPPFFETFAP